MYLSVVIPAYNELRSLKKNSLKAVFTYLKNQSFQSEIIIVNDGSTDQTYKLLHQQYNTQPNLKIINNKHLGKGASLITGFQQSHGKFVLFTDFDQSTPITEFNKFKKYLNNYDLIIGSRQTRDKSPITRKCVSYSFIMIRKLILGLPFKDTQCGFKLIKRKALINIIPHTTTSKNMTVKTSYFTDVAFDLELLLIAQKQKFKIKEVSVNWKHEPRDLNLVKLILDVIIELLKLKFKLITGFYEK